MKSQIDGTEDSPLFIIAKQFFERFAGLNRAYGRMRIMGVVSDKGKQQTQCDTVREPLTVALWAKHLAGTDHLGVVPITDESTVCWGAIDIDSYASFDLIKLADHVARLELPLIVCRSKSGGGHLYCFTSEPVSADLMRGKLMEWAIAMGYSGSEVFPKQTRLAGLNDVGNWINMPYQSGDDTMRYAITGDKKLTCYEFLQLAELMALTSEQLKATQPSAISQYHEEFLESPPCLASLAIRGFGEGSRNNALFNIAVYLQKRYGDEDWEKHIDVYNQNFMVPPLKSSEVQECVKHVKNKKYFYKCNDQPIVSVCNKQICLTKAYGIGGGSNDPGVVFGALQKITTEPPIWILNVDGANLELTTLELRDQSRLATKCMEVLNKYPRPIKVFEFADIIRDKLQSVEIIQAPAEATLTGAVSTWLEEYCTSKAQARSKEELLLKKPWTEDGYVYFSALGFKSFLSQQRVLLDERQLWSIMRKLGGESVPLRIKGKQARYWRVKAFAVQTEDFSLPELPEAM